MCVMYNFVKESKSKSEIAQERNPRMAKGARRDPVHVEFNPRGLSGLLAVVTAQNSWPSHFDQAVCEHDMI